MINHARTLLLNTAGPRTAQPDVPGDDYIPSFEPIELPATLRDVHQVLFGSNPDYTGLVYRTSQYLGILHSTEYKDYVFNLDSRITYNPDDLGVIDGALYGSIVRGDSALTVNGTWADAGKLGRVNTKWRITATSASTVLVENLTDNLADEFNLDETKTLVGSTLVFSIAEQPYTPGETWRVYHQARVAPDLSQVLATLKTLSAEAVTDIFGAKPQPEPFKTFYKLFKNHYAAPYQFTGLLLGYIYKLETVRTSTDG